MDNINSIIMELEQIEKEINLLNNIIADAPEGGLTARTQPNGKYKYFKNIRENGKRKEKYISRNELSTAVKLANKYYSKERLKDLINRKNYLSACIQYSQSSSNADEFLKKHPGFLPLIYRDYPDLSKNAAEWKNAAYNRSMNYPDGLKYTTVIPDLKVRSKSESEIVSILVKNGVPFRYEEIHCINGIDYAMDFTCLNVRTNTIFYWDHQGMSDNASYMNTRYSCLQAYQQEGIIPWINLIITNETKDNPLDVQWAEAIVRYYLI